MGLSQGESVGEEERSLFFVVVWPRAHWPEWDRGRYLQLG